MPETTGNSTTHALIPFRPGDATIVAGWVNSDEDMFRLAPQTPPPLTPRKVREWQKPGVHSFVHVPTPGSRPIGYGEINDLQDAPGCGWIGHLLIEPARRRQGHGRALVRGLTAYGFGQLDYATVYLLVFPGNPGAIRCYEQAGYVFDGNEARWFDGIAQELLMVRMIARRRTFPADGATPAATTAAPNR